MRRVRCVSPHGGAHNGLRADNELPAAPGYSGALRLPPNEGGWVVNPVLGYVAVGDEVDALEAPEFIADGFHFIDAASGKGDACEAPGDACWCGQHRHMAAHTEHDTGPREDGGVDAPELPASAPSLADLLIKKENG